MIIQGTLLYTSQQRQVITCALFNGIYDFHDSLIGLKTNNYFFLFINRKNNY